MENSTYIGFKVKRYTGDRCDLSIYLANHKVTVENHLLKRVNEFNFSERKEAECAYTDVIEFCTVRQLKGIQVSESQTSAVLKSCEGLILE